MPVQLPDGQRIARIQAGLGLCRFPYEGATPGDIIRLADQAMYSVKRAGGSSVAQYAAKDAGPLAVTTA